MPRLPILSGTDIVRIFQRLGYRVVRQRGSHIRLHGIGRKPLTVPRHAVIGRGLLRKILRDAELSAEEFAKLLAER